jgi:uncharacterized phage protein gp47/JayE
MPFNRPSLPDLRVRVRGDFRAHMPGAAAALQIRRSRVGVTADVIAGVNHMELGYLDWLANGVLMPDTSDDEYLVRWAASFGVNRKLPTPASGTVTFTGLPGIPIAAGTQLATQDGAVNYVTTAGGTLSTGGAPSLALAVTAQTTGDAGNQAAGVALNLVVAIAGVNPTASVNAPGLAGGADAEAIELLRQRLLLRLRTPPQGGAATDYVQWALTVPGVTRAWCYPLARGAGTVNVLFTFDDRPNPIPTGGDVALMQTTLAGLAPVTANVLAVAPIAAPQAFVIAALTPPTADVQAAIIAELDDLVGTVGPGGATVGSGVSTASPGGKLWLSQIEGAINAAPGVAHYDLTTPAADVVVATGVLITLGTVTFT